MGIKTTRHTSTDFDEINRKIARLLKDPSDAMDQAPIDIDAMSLSDLKAFAEQGGLGACVSKEDVLAETPEDLMYLSGERIIVLKHVEDDIYLGYCEGVIGQFNAESVHFVELDPRVLESLDADLEFSMDQSYGGRYSAASQNTDFDYTARSHDDPKRDPLRPDLDSHTRHSIRSFSSTSEQYSPSIHERPWLHRSSFESLNTHNSAPSPLSTSHIGQHMPGIDDTLSINSERKDDDVFDTSALNEDYSDESEEETGKRRGATTYNKQQQQQQQQQRAPGPLVVEPSVSMVRASRTARPSISESISHTTRPSPVMRPAPTTRPTPSRSTANEPPKANVGHEDDHMHDGDDESENGDTSAVAPKKPVKSLSLTTKNDSVDEYGFIVDLSSQKANHGTMRSDISAKSMKAYREREAKWLSIVGKLDAGTAKKDAKLKKLVRSGIPGSVRARAWQFLAGSMDYKKKGYYESLGKRKPTEIYSVIERDIARCYPDHSQFNDANGQGQLDLRNILKAYSQHNPQVGYCQGMGRLAGCMLMHMPAEDTFYLMVATLDRYMNGYFTPTLSQLRIDAYIIGQLLHDHLPKLAQHLEANDIMPIMYIAQWFLTAFTMALPWQSVLRVWDVFYRISLAILEISKDHLLNSCPTNSELLAFLLHIPHKYLGPDLLLDTAFRIKLSKTDIKKYAKKASTSSDSTTMGLPFEHGIKNLMVGESHAGSLSGLKGLGKHK
ncbi:rab-GTPase-TBC domain-containing protein [Phycomyces nitens]|nr:rab-GTPase-TBC domain-containing protein [Phycomyces nitens]